MHKAPATRGVEATRLDAEAIILFRDIAAHVFSGIAAATQAGAPASDASAQKAVPPPLTRRGSSLQSRMGALLFGQVCNSCIAATCV